MLSPLQKPASLELNKYLWVEHPTKYQGYKDYTKSLTLLGLCLSLWNTGWNTGFKREYLPSSCHWLQKLRNFQARENKDGISTYHVLLHSVSNWCNFQLLYIRNAYGPLSGPGARTHPAPAPAGPLLCILHRIIKRKHKTRQMIQNYKVIHEIQHKWTVRYPSPEKNQNSKTTFNIRK